MRMRKSTSLLLWHGRLTRLLLLLLLLTTILWTRRPQDGPWLEGVHAFSTRVATTTTTGTTTTFPHNKVVIHVPLNQVRPSPKNGWETWERLWNDKRSLADLWRDAAATAAADKNNDNNNDNNNDRIPYCLVSDKFTINASSNNNLTFQVLLYPRGVYSSATATTSSTSPTTMTAQTPASAYLSFCGNDNDNNDDMTEADVAWKLQLVNNRTNETLPVVTSGGLPVSNTTWSAAMTFCSSPTAALDSLGRTVDWGSSTWKAVDVCRSNSVHEHLVARVELTVFDVRRHDRSMAMFSWPPPRGTWGAVWRAVTAAHPNNNNHYAWTAGQVVVAIPRNATERRYLERQYGIYAGVDYRIMTMRNAAGQEIFSTASSSSSAQDAQLALRPVGWKLQSQLWRQRGWHTWPVEVPFTELQNVLYSRLHPRATLPRLAAFGKDVRALGLALAVATAPLAAAAVGRQFVTLTAIPSASMDPTLIKGDVLVVETLPAVYSRIHRGDIVLFRAPTALQETIRQAGGKAVSPNQLFVKRLVGLPGDEDIRWQANDKQVTISGQPAVGPPRNLCDDEPLRMIDFYLQKGQGTHIDLLGPDETYVLGDCQAVSIDSRVFGKLPKENIVGRPVARIWPLDRFMLGSPK